MSSRSSPNAGEVAVSTIDVMPSFERKSIMILRHVDKLFENENLLDIPEEVRKLFQDTYSKNKISQLIEILATYHLRPIVRHQPDCSCVGADENIFANILRFSLDGKTSEAMLLSALLIKIDAVSELVRIAKTVAQIIKKDLQKPKRKNFVEQTYYTQIH